MERVERIDMPRITVKTLDGAAFVESMERLREIFPNEVKSWFDRCNIRLYDVEYIDTDNKGTKTYYVYKNKEELDDTFPQDYYVVKIDKVGFGLCGCSRGEKNCTHVGTTHLFELYHYYRKHKTFPKINMKKFTLDKKEEFKVDNQKLERKVRVTKEKDIHRTVIRALIITIADKAKKINAGVTSTIIVNELKQRGFSSHPYVYEEFENLVKDEILIPAPDNCWCITKFNGTGRPYPMQVSNGIRKIFVLNDNLKVLVKRSKELIETYKKLQKQSDTIKRMIEVAKDVKDLWL